MLTRIIPTTPFSYRFEERYTGGSREGGCDEEDHKGEEEEWILKKEQLAVIIVMFNQTPAIKLINTLFPV